VDNSQHSQDTSKFNPLNAELNPICHLLALLGAHLILHDSRIRVKTPSDMKCKVSSLLSLSSAPAEFLQGGAQYCYVGKTGNVRIT